VFTSEAVEEQAAKRQETQRGRAATKTTTEGNEENEGREILSHLGVWHDPPSAGLSAGVPSPWQREPCLDDPMPDYENVLTD